MQIINLSFDQDLQARALEEITEHTILVFPTRISAQKARLDYEKHWHFEELIFCSIENFKDILLSVETPFLEEEKRLLTLYQVLTPQQKEYFHITDYSLMVEWGQHFFQFMQEFCEAGFDVLKFKDILLDTQLNLKEWQEKHIAHLFEITVNYHRRLQDLGFTDRIFEYESPQTDLPYQGYRIIFVNQYYYSKLETNLINSCAHANEIIIIYHGATSDIENWPTTQFDLQHSFDNLPSKPVVKIYESSAEDQHAMACAARIPCMKPGVIIDPTFHNQPYSGFFDVVDVQRPLPITQSAYFAYLAFLRELLESQLNHPGYIPLRLIIRRLRDPQIAQTINPAWQREDQFKLMQQLFELSGNGILYLDLEPEDQFGEQPKYLVTMDLCCKLFALVKKILKIRSIEDLIQLFSDELDPQNIGNHQELTKTNLLPRVFTALANFAAIEKLGVVNDWEKIFVEPGIGIFGLWLDFLKSQGLRYEAPLSNSTWEISNLLDARNRCFDYPVFLQMEEGIMPKSPDAIWLLNETQRRHLGMISYDDIRDWERYYFFRLVLCAKEVTIFCYQNQEKNINVSSFVGELSHLYAEEAQLFTYEKIAKIANSQLFANYAMDSNLKKYRSQKLTADFFCLPVEPQKDFGKNHEISQTSYDLKMLCENPFAWYISSLREIKPKIVELEETISPPLFGNLMHKFFNEILGKKPSHHKDLSKIRSIFEDHSTLTHKLQEIINRPEYNYKIPKNHNAKYLKTIISPRLADSLQEFYKRFLSWYLKDSEFTLIPEEEYMTYKEEHYQILTIVKHDNVEYTVKIRGKADLRIETPSIRIIVDFKTGRATEDQLIFYEYFYYLISDMQLKERLRSYIWQILDMSIDPCSKKVPASRDGYPQKIANALQSCLENGYMIAQKSQGKLTLQSISRSDLWINTGETNEI
nr:hypothetical protein [Candidatus Cloacimonadota bacterium]